MEKRRRANGKGTLTQLNNGHRGAMCMVVHRDKLIEWMNDKVCA